MEDSVGDYVYNVDSIKYSDLRAQKRKSVVELSSLDGPTAVFIEFTNRCNFKCGFCPQSFPDYLKRVNGISNLSLGDFTKIIENLQNLDTLKVLRFYMLGETLLHPNAHNFFDMARSILPAVRFEITTNGSIVTDTIARSLILNMDYIRVSIYSVNQEKHSIITNSVIKCESIYNNVKKLFELRKTMEKNHGEKPFIYVKMINSFDEIENRKFIDSYKKISDECCIENPMNWNDLENRDLIYKNYASMTNTQLDVSALFPYTDKMGCPYPFYTLVINSNLDVTVCCVDWARMLVVGNLKTETIREIWSGNKLKTLQKKQLDGKRSEIEACKNCTFLYTSPDNLSNVEN